jgi:hypothetical protein
VLRTVQAAATHALRHLAVVASDAARLEKKNGCCAEPLPRRRRTSRRA